MSAHTPGPWESPGLDGDARVICATDRSGKRRTIAHVYGATPVIRDSTAAGITALPELVDALYGLLLVAKQDLPFWDDASTTNGEAVLRAQDALAKARS